MSPLHSPLRHAGAKSCLRGVASLIVLLSSLALLSVCALFTFPFFTRRECHCGTACCASPEAWHDNSYWLFETNAFGPALGAVLFGVFR